MLLDKIAGCLLGGAVGDALGAPVETLPFDEIRDRYGLDGINYYDKVEGKFGAVTDDTQLILFTLEGIMGAYLRGSIKGIVSLESMVERSYVRWLGTQGIVSHNKNVERLEIYRGWLWDNPVMHSQRSPLQTLLDSCQYHLKCFEEGDYDIHLPVADNPDCGAVMKSAPSGFFKTFEPFQSAKRIAAITHGNSDSCLYAAVFAKLISYVIHGYTLPDALEKTLKEALQYGSSDIFLNSIENFVKQIENQDVTPENLEKIGSGKTSEEAFKITLFCSLKAQDFTHGIHSAVNHNGKSDTTASLTGALLGALYGKTGIPEDYLKPLEVREIIEEMAQDVMLYEYTDSWWQEWGEPGDPVYHTKYPAY